MKKVKIGVLISGGGSNLQAIIDATQTTLLNCAEVAFVISNKPKVFGLQRAEKAKIPNLFLDPKLFTNKSAFYKKVIQIFQNAQIEIICLAGFLSKLEPNILQTYPNKILNIHPSLLPKFGGKGMYGHFVHEAVLKSNEKESGCTVHLVNEEFDQGQILMQQKVLIQAEDSAETLAARILKQEHILFPKAIAHFIQSTHSI